MFFKVALNQLLPYWLYNYKIQLEADNNLSFHLLFKQSLKELLAIKQYIVENLKKEFINYNQTLFASLILFVKKANSSLYFYINF